MAGQKKNVRALTQLQHTRGPQNDGWFAFGLSFITRHVLPDPLQTVNHRLGSQCHNDQPFLVSLSRPAKHPPPTHGCGSKNRHQNGTLVSGNMDQNLTPPQTHRFAASLRSAPGGVSSRSRDHGHGEIDGASAAASLPASESGQRLTGAASR